MPCCGKQRRQLQLRPQTRPGAEVTSQPATAPKAQWGIRFRYTGKTGLTVYGPSGRHYRFNEPGAIVEVEPTDAPALKTVPRLQQVAD
jgi:hypothetical protein